MPEQTLKIRVFVASPSDVTKEREHLKAVIDELNTTIAPFKNLSIELVKWESHATPSMGRPQEVINSQIGQYDIFVGIMWTRFGTPTGNAESGTEEEFQLAYKQWENSKSIWILFYFCQKPFMPRKVDEIAQLQKVIEFRESLSSLGLTWEYSDSNEFPNVVRPHLARILLDTVVDEEVMKTKPKKKIKSYFSHNDTCEFRDLQAGFFGGDETHHYDESGGKIGIFNSVETITIKRQPRIFISSASQDLASVHKLASFLKGVDVEVIQWDQGVFSAGRSILEAFDSALSNIDAAIVLLGSEPPSHNMMFELGIMQGKYGRAKTIILSPENAILPSDLMGAIYLRYTKDNIGTIMPNLHRELIHMGLLKNEHYKSHNQT